MIRIISKDSIEKYNLPYLSLAKRGGTRTNLWEIVNAILYKFKTGIQWHLLPVNSLIANATIKYGAVYNHFRKWVKDGSWGQVQRSILIAYQSCLDLSISHFDGTHSLAKRGGEAVGYQRRKKGKTTNTLWLTDANGIAVGFTLPIAGNHHDIYDCEKRLKYLVEQLQQSHIEVEGLFVNADAGFDSEAFRKACEKLGILLNAPRNRRRNKDLSDDDTYFDELMYQKRYVVERTNAWMDSYRTLLLRQDTSLSSWVAWHHIFLIIQWIKSLTKL